MSSSFLLSRCLLGAAVFAPLVLQTAAAQTREDRRLDTVVVTGNPLTPRAADEIIQPVTLLHGDELDRRTAPSLGETLDGLPGVANADFGPGVGRPVIRGLQGSRVQILDDGLPVVDVAGEGVDHAVAIDTSSADQIEIFRGPATLIYGSGAAGGVVNVRSFRFNPDFSERGLLRLNGAYGENGNDRLLDAQGELPVTDNLVLRAHGGIRRTDDFSIKGFQEDDQTEGLRGTLQNSSIETEHAGITALYRAERGFIAGAFSTWNTDYGIPEVFDPQRLRGDGSDEFERVTADYDRFDIRGEVNDPLPGFSLLRIKTAYTKFSQQETAFEFSRSDGELEDTEVEVAFENNQFDTRIDLLHNPVAGWQGVFGLQYTDRDFFGDDPRGADRGFYVRPNRTRNLAGYVIEELETGFGRIELGARLERVRSSSDPVIGSRVPGVTQPDGSFLPLPETLSSRTDNAVSLSAGSLIDVADDHHVRLSLTRAERVPSGEQRYAFGRHAAAGTWEVGNPDLKKETYVNFEAGFDRHTGRLRYEVTAFYNRVDDYIFLASEDDGTGSPVFVNDIGNREGEGAAAGCLPGAGGLCRLRNQLVFHEQADAEFYGAELAARFEASDGPIPLTLFASADIVRGKLRDGGDLPRITPPRISVGAETRLAGVNLRAEYQRVMQQTRTAEAEEETDGYNLVSVDGSYEILPNTVVYVRGRNLLDEAGRRHQSFFKEEAPILGRAVFIGLRTQFGG